MPDAVLVERPRPQVAVIRLNRPEKLNAMNIDLVDGIHDALDEVDADNDIRVVILTGAGRGFCSGADLTGFGEVPGTDDLGPVPTMFRHQQRIARLIPRMRALRKPEDQDPLSYSRVIAFAADRIISIKKVKVTDPKDMKLKVMKIAAPLPAGIPDTPAVREALASELRGETEDDEPPNCAGRAAATCLVCDEQCSDPWKAD